jgi:hypothetical protein
MVAPEAVLPFKVTQQQASEAVKTWLKSLWFAPNALSRFARQETMQGVYLPFWTYDSYTVSSYSGERGEHYYETERYTTTDANGNQVEQTRQVQKTRWYPRSGMVDRWFEDIPIPATQALPEPRLRSLEPWDFPELVPYEPSFLAGYQAQCYQISVAQGFDHAKKRMDDTIQSDVREAIGGDEQRVHGVDTSYNSITFKHVLLPLWVGAYHFNDKVYQLTVNARSGQVQGDRPYSIWKILALVLVILAIIAAIVVSQQHKPDHGRSLAPTSRPAQTRRLVRLAVEGRGDRLAAA